MDARCGSNARSGCSDAASGDQEARRPNPPERNATANAPDRGRSGGDRWGADASAGAAPSHVSRFTALLLCQAFPTT
jgi:hypothetical protein